MALRNTPLAMGLKPVTGLADGVDDNDAVNKGQLDAAAAAVQDALDALVIPALAQVDFLSGLIPVPTNTDYRLVLKAPYAMTITETVTRCLSGTATATFKINTTALGGSAHSVSSSEQSIVRSSANVVAVDDDIVLTVSANSTCLDFSFLIKFTRTLTA